MFDVNHDDVIKWEHFPRHWPFVWAVHRSQVNIPRKGQWRGALIFSLIGTRTPVEVNNLDAGDLRRHRAHYDVTVIWLQYHPCTAFCSLDASKLWLSRIVDTRRHRTPYTLSWLEISGFFCNETHDEAKGDSDRTMNIYRNIHAVWWCFILLLL